MIYFMASREGGKYIKIIRKGSNRPREIVDMFKEEKVILLFRCGMIWDSFLRYAPTKWRHCLLGGRKGAKEKYKELMKMDLPTEYIANQ